MEHVAATKTDSGCTITHTGLTYHDVSINVGDKNVQIVILHHKTLTLNTSRAGTSKENITYNFGISSNTISGITDSAKVIDNYVPLQLVPIQSKVDFRNTKSDTNVVEANSAVYNYGKEFYIENTINYGSRIGDTLTKGFTNYLKIDNDAIKILDTSEGSGKDYTIKFDGETTGLKEESDYTLEYMVGEWNANYFHKKDNAPSYCKDLSSLTKRRINELLWWTLY